MNILPIVSTLQASAAATAVLGDQIRVYEDIAPRKTDFPYAVWSVIHGEPDNNLDCPATTDHISFQIVVYDSNQKRASEVRQVVRQVLEQHCYVTAIHPSHFERIADTNIFGRGFDANWFLSR